ncbi:MAG TPA: sensor domain-containing diguanylate cyclase [Acidimicrobiales bacterium]|nr:sensor domain-containing diguanylate cyclase [Acidimicrobiales bacterium]
MTGDELGPEEFRAIWEYSADGVLFTAPDGRIFAANPAACTLLRMTEEEICAAGRAGIVDPDDGRWDELVAERDRAGRVRGEGRMCRGDGTLVEVEIASQVFGAPDGDGPAERRTCTIVREITARVAMEHELEEMSEQLRELALTDELTGLRNRRGFLAVGAHMLEVADRHVSNAQLLYLDVDNMKDLNDNLGHAAGDAGLRAVAGALTRVLRHADVVSRIGGDEFVALVLGLDDERRVVVERRIDGYLRAAPTVDAVGRPVEVSIGWAARVPFDPATVEDLLAEADRAMYRVKAIKLAARQ